MRAVLTFHSVDDSGSVLSIAPEQLRSLVRAIRASGHRIVGLRELLESPGEPSRIALSFDDGLRSLHRHALSVLREEGVPATLFLIGDYVGRDNRWPSQPESVPTMEMMSWEEVEDLVDAGWSIEAHTATHPDLRRLSDEAIREELERGDEALVRRLGRRPELFAYPYGTHDARVRELVAKRYRYAVTADMGSVESPIRAPHRIPRLESYYFRAAPVHARFGTLGFSGYLAARTWLRRLRAA